MRSLSTRWHDGVPLSKDGLLNLAQIVLQLVGDGLDGAEDLRLHRLLLLAALRISRSGLCGGLGRSLLEAEPLYAPVRIQAMVQEMEVEVRTLFFIACEKPIWPFGTLSISTFWSTPSAGTAVQICASGLPLSR